MDEVNKKNNSNDFDEIDLQEIFYFLLENKRIIFSLTALASTIGVIVSLLLPNIYESKAMLVPVNASSGISATLQNYSGLAGLAGISLPSSEDEDNSTKAIEKIQSLSFFENNILPNIFLPDLMALKFWDHETNSLVYDENIYNKYKNAWVRSYRYPQKQIPSAQESFEEYITKFFSVTQSIDTGFITISIKHQSPFIAKQWTELIVLEINNFYRQKDKSEAEKAVSYLNEQILMTGLTEIKQVISELLREETQKLALIEANEFYVFDYIDPPAVMEEHEEPNRIIICIISLFLGAIIGIIFVLLKYYRLEKSN